MNCKGRKNLLNENGMKMVFTQQRGLKPLLKEQCHAIWQLYKKLEGVFASIEF